MTLYFSVEISQLTTIFNFVSYKAAVSQVEAKWVNKLEISLKAMKNLNVKITSLFPNQISLVTCILLSLTL